MSKKWKRTLALAAMIGTMFAGTVNVSAEGVKDVFDAKYYADTNADLKAVFGYDEKALFNHYMTFGLSEGRCGSPTFNVAEYRKAYPDLEAAFGNDWDAYVNHYFEFGKAEGRTAGTPGAAGSTAALGNQQIAAAQPIDTYIQHGSKFYNADWTPKENKTMTKVYGPEAYIKCWADDGLPDKIVVNREISIKDTDYWNTNTGAAPEGYEIKTLRFAVRNGMEDARIAANGNYAVNALRAGDFDYTKWVIDWESANVVNKPKQHNSSSAGENTASYSDAFTVDYNGVQYEGCSVQVSMEYTKFKGYPHAFYDVSVCLPKGYNDFTVSVSYPESKHTKTIYIPMP